MSKDQSNLPDKKVQKWWYFNGPLVLAWLAVGVVGGGISILAELGAKKEKAVRNKLYEYKKEIPNYFEYEVALKAYEDSLYNAISMWPWKNKEH